MVIASVRLLSTGLIFKVDKDVQSPITQKSEAIPDSVLALSKNPPLSQRTALPRSFKGSQPSGALQWPRGPKQLPVVPVG